MSDLPQDPIAHDIGAKMGSDSKQRSQVPSPARRPRFHPTAATPRHTSTIAASRCPRCHEVVAPPATFCPHHPVHMVPTSLPGVGEVVSFTTLHSPPEGFRSPLNIALVELEGGARFVCHGAQTRGLKVGSQVAIEAIDDVYYFSHLGALDRARLFWRRAGRAGDRVNAIARSVAKKVWKGTPDG